jgi:lysophospholipase L1-like esterase
VIPVVGARHQLNLLLTYGLLYQARNTLLGITNTTKRPVIQGRYELNKQFLQMMIEIAQAHGVQFIMYINPLNPQADNPYVASEYAAFKDWAAATATAHKVPFANFENLVPKDAWGLFMGGPDFKHFSGEGHRLTAEAIAKEFGPVLTASPGVP